MQALGLKLADSAETVADIGNEGVWQARKQVLENAALYRKNYMNTGKNLLGQHCRRVATTFQGRENSTLNWRQHSK
jgi:hypothetical protein